MIKTNPSATNKNAFKDLLAMATGAPLRTAVVHPVDSLSLGAAIEAAERDLLTPVLVGPTAKIQAAAEALGKSIDSFEIEDVPHSHAAAERAVELARAGKVDALMKGALHTNEMMAAAVNRTTGLRTERRMSHVFVMDTPAYSKYLLISDGALNIAPDLMTKQSIVQNAIDVAQAIGVATPLVAILSATEEVDPKIPSTLDAAALCKMADRGQITGGILDGPLAFDLAVSKEAVKVKGLKSEVAGDTDILIVPNLEGGNMIAKQLDYLAGASAAGIIMGATVPIILTSRADSVIERLASCALAKCIIAKRNAAA